MAEIKIENVTKRFGSFVAVNNANLTIGDREFMVLLGSFESLPLCTAAALLGVILGAVYMLTLYMRVMFGELNQERNGALKDLSLREAVTLLPLVVLIFWMGVFPQPVLRRAEMSLRTFHGLVVTRAEWARRGIGAGLRPVFDAAEGR